MTNYYKKMKVFEDMNYHSSCAHNLSSCEIKPWKKTRNSGLNGTRTQADDYGQSRINSYDAHIMPYKQTILGKLKKTSLVRTVLF